MKIESTQNRALFTMFPARKYRLFGSVMCFLLLIGFSILHFFYPEIDRQVGLWINTVLPRSRAYFFFDNVTELGNIILILPMAFLAFLALLWRKNWEQAVRLVMAVFGGAAFGYTLKLFYSQSVSLAETNPQDTLNLGFPSGHSMMSLLFYGWLTYFLIRVLRTPVWRWIAALAGALLILTIGVSRLFLSVHLPTDVLGGWAAGGLWFIVSSWLSTWLIETGFPTIRSRFYHKPVKE